MPVLISRWKKRSAQAARTSFASALALLFPASCDSSPIDARPAAAPGNEEGATPSPKQVGLRSEPAKSSKDPPPDRSKFIKALGLVTTEAGFVEAVETLDAACAEISEDEHDPAIAGFCRTHKGFRAASDAARKEPSKRTQIVAMTKVWKEDLDLLSVSLTKKHLRMASDDEKPATPRDKPPSNQECEVTFQCPDGEECLGKKGSKKCRPATPEDCESWWRCENDGYCTAIDGRCLLGVKTDADCKRSYGNRPGGGFNPCALGACRAVGGDCVE